MHWRQLIQCARPVATKVYSHSPLHRFRGHNFPHRNTLGAVSLTCSRNSSSDTSEPSVPSQARVVICGGGVIGTSIAYHLAERGWTDVVLLEQGSLTCGTTWHSAGLVGVVKDYSKMVNLLQYSRDLYKRFEEEGDGLGWKQCGSLELAQTKDRMVLMQRKKAVADAVGEEVHMLLPKDIKEKCPWLRFDDLQGGLWAPGDGVVTAPDVAQVFARKAKAKGVKIIQGIGVERVLTDDNRHVSSVETVQGQTIKCEKFVNCSGQWARQLGKKSIPKVRVPLHSCEHFYIVTQPIEGMDPMLPVIRDPDGHVYFREWNGGIMAGGFEPPSHGGKPVFHSGVPSDFHYQLFPEDWDHFQILLDGILQRMPELNNAQIRGLTNGPESFTPDKNWILGESAEVYNYYVAAGMHSRGIQGAGGIGKHMAEWIIDGEPSLDLWDCDIKRFVVHHNNKKFLRDRVKETIGLYHLPYPHDNFQSGRNLRTSPTHTQLNVAGAVFGENNAYERAMYFTSVHDGLYDLQYPLDCFKSGRNLRTSPIHTQLKVAGANFGETNAYERAICFSPTTDDYRRINLLDDYVDPRVQQKGTFGKPGWFECVKEEYYACKERVCLVDMSSFTKIEITSKGSEALDYLQYLCSNDINQDIGTIIHTGMQNKHGAYENDCSIVPLRDFYFMIAPTTQQTRSLFWMQKYLPQDGSVSIRDVTSMYSGLNLIGPHAEQLLDDVTEVSTKKTDFKPMTCQVIDVGYASNIITMRLTHTGEDGFLLYIPSEYALHVYEVLMKAGKDYGIMNAGYYAMRHLRIEKLFAYWGTDLDPHTTPYETGREFRVKFEKGDFIGKEALLKQKQNGISKKFAQFLLEDFDLEKDNWPWGNEPIYRNGKYVGMTTSSSYGFTLDKFCCLGFVHHTDENGNPVISKQINDYIMDKSAKYEIDVAGKRYPAKVDIYTPKAAYRSTHKPTFIPVPSHTLIH